MNNYTNYQKSYTLIKITPISELCGKDRRGLDIASSTAKSSQFAGAHGIGCCVLFKGQCLQGREST